MDTVEKLKQMYEASKQLSYVFFWGHTSSNEGEVSKSCLSQWWQCEFVVEGDKYTSAEQYMMAEKARLFEDDETRQKILQTLEPKAVKSLGRQVKHFDEVKWNEAKVAIVKKGNMAKFTQDRYLKNFLLDTENKVLVEASPYDCIWGIGLGAETLNIENPWTWKGENLLGFVLMEVREAIRMS